MPAFARFGYGRVRATVFPEPRELADMAPTVETDVDLEAIREGLAPLPVQLGVVFGSTVHGPTHPFSDVDIGIVFDAGVAAEARGALLARMTAELGSILGTDDLDVVDLDTAPPAIAYDALSTGVLVLGEDERRIELEARALQLKFDFDPILQAWSAALEERLETGEYGRA